MEKMFKRIIKIPYSKMKAIVNLNTKPIYPKTNKTIWKSHL